MTGTIDFTDTARTARALLGAAHPAREGVARRAQAHGVRVDVLQQALHELLRRERGLLDLPLQAEERLHDGSHERVALALELRGDGHGQHAARHGERSMRRRLDPAAVQQHVPVALRAR